MCPTSSVGLGKCRTPFPPPHVAQEYVGRPSSTSLGKYLMAGRVATNCALSITELQRLSRSYVVCLGDKMHAVFFTSKQVLFVPFNFQAKYIYRCISVYSLFFIKNEPLSASYSQFWPLWSEKSYVFLRMYFYVYFMKVFFPYEAHKLSIQKELWNTFSKELSVYYCIDYLLRVSKCLDKRTSSEG